MWFFKSKKAIVEKLVLPFSTDVHSHVLPGIDDGAKNLEDAVALVTKMYDMGYRKLIATPHISLEYNNTPESIYTSLNSLKSELALNKIPMEVEAAAEYMIDEGFVAHLSNNEPLLTFGNNEVLIEMGYVQESPYLGEVLFRLKAMGYTPVWAHPERYRYYDDKDIETLLAYKMDGCKFQLNILALAKYYGTSVYKKAILLLENNLYDYCGSDFHNIRHIDATENAMGEICKSIVNKNMHNSIL